MKIAISTDTNSGVSQEEAKKMGIYVLPMPVLIEDQVYLEGTDIRNDQLYEAMRQHKNLSTSQPSPGQLLELWDGILRDGFDELVYIPMSSGLSGSCQNAMQFASEYDGCVQVVDNHRISVTQRESVYSAVQLVQSGYSAKEIKAFLEVRAFDASIYISVDSMDYLKKGGRITPAVAAFATVLNLKPVLTIQGDKLDTYAKARGMKQAEQKMIEAVKTDRTTRFADVPDSHLQIGVAGTLESEEQAQRWFQCVENEFPGMTLPYVHLPCSIACHVGMNAVGIGIIKKEVL